jgi:signal transduction histidine kinase
LRIPLFSGGILVVVALIAHFLGDDRAFSLLFILLGILLVHVGRAALVRHGRWLGVVNVFTRLANLMAYTLAALLFGGLDSPLIPLYAEDILSASLRDGRQGAWYGWTLVTLALIGLTISSDALDASGIVRFLVYIAVMGIIALIAGELGQRRIESQVKLAQQTLENARLYAELEERAQRLNAAYEELKELDQRKTEFVQSVSHELRTPLLFIRGYTELLLDGGLGQLNPEQQEKLDIVARKTQLLADLVRDIVSLQRGRPREEEMQEISLAQLARQATASAEAMAQELGIQVSLELPEHDLRIRGVPRRLEEVFDNLLGNALKFSPDGGEIKVQTQIRDGFVQVSVADEGIGVPPEEQERIFERFYQVDSTTTRRFEGTGLGLSIVKQIVEGHGGQVWVISPTLKDAAGRGSTFYFTLPHI